MKEAKTGKSGETNPNLWKSIIFGLTWNGFPCGVCFYVFPSVFALHFEIGHICGQNGAFGAQDRRQNRSFFVSIFVFVFVFVFSLNSPRLVTLVVKEVQVAEVHLAANTEGNIVPSESEYVPVQAVAVGSERQTVKFRGNMCIVYINVGYA